MPHNVQLFMIGSIKIVSTVMNENISTITKKNAIHVLLQRNLILILIIV